MTTQELAEMAKELMKNNPGCAISGSLGLKLQGVKTKREPNDIDVYVPWGATFTKPEGFSLMGTRGDDYDEEEYERLSYKNHKTGIYLDVFKALRDDLTSFRILDGDIPMIAPEDIIRFKIRHAFGDHFSRFKHRMDVIYMMSVLNN